MGDVRARVLVVDDDDDNLGVVREILESEGYAVDTASSGGAALRYVRKATSPCLLVLDLKMAPPTGWDIINALRCEDQLRAFRVVVLSAVPGDLIPHGTRHVPKPFSIPALLDAVRTEIEDM